MAAEVHGVPDAQYEYGVLLEKGRQCKKDKTKAAVMFALAAEQGHLEALYKLAMLYFRNPDIPIHKSNLGNDANPESDSLDASGATEAMMKPNIRETGRLLRIASKRGHAKSQCSLGMKLIAIPR